jgi:hypothetical protein
VEPKGSVIELSGILLCRGRGVSYMPGFCISLEQD